jgi:hypothetical protein
MLQGNLLDEKNSSSMEPESRSRVIPFPSQPATSLRRYDPVRTVADRNFRSHLLAMKQSDIFRDNADNCLQLAERAEGQPAFNRYKRMADAWTALAQEQDWLDGEIPPLGAPKRQALRATQFSVS